MLKSCGDVKRLVAKNVQFDPSDRWVVYFPIAQAGLQVSFGGQRFARRPTAIEQTVRARPQRVCPSSEATEARRFRMSL